LQSRTALIVAPTLEAREHVYGEIKDLERKIAEKDQHAAYHDSIAQKEIRARPACRAGGLPRW
jgi:hypothetical protein